MLPQGMVKWASHSGRMWFAGGEEELELCQHEYQNATPFNSINFPANSK